MKFSKPIDFFETEWYTVYKELIFVKKFFEYNFNIDKIVLACYVPKGAGEIVHTNRTSHGLALHVSGKKKYVFEGENTIYTGKNDIIFMPEHANYVVETESLGACYAINFKIPEEMAFEPFVLNMGDLVTDKFKHAEKAFRLKTSGYEMQCKASLYAVICSMLGEYEKKYVPKSRIKIIAPAIEYIHENYTSENISVAYLAKICGISTVYFRNIFLKCKNTTPVKYINDLRLARAKELLVSGYYSIPQIVEFSGFGDESYFCRYFKKMTGMTAMEYRRYRNTMLD